MIRILLVEDEKVLGDTVKLALEKMGYSCDLARTLKDANILLAQFHYDLALLDWNLPDGEGLSLLQHPKRAQFRVMVLSSRSSVAERVTGLTQGADDYLPKPFNFSELEARVLALTRRIAVPVPEPDSLWQLDDGTLAAQTPVGRVELTPLEFKFLKYVIERHSTIISKDRLLRDVWGFTLLPKTRTVDYVITQLRKRIELDPESPVHLLTVRGAGVKFMR